MIRDSDLIHLWRCKEAALEQLLANVALPVETHSFRQAHEHYLLYLHALLDLADEMAGGSVSPLWRQALGGLGEFDGRYNASYLRELRNAAIKRGVDITSKGKVANDQTCALAPEVSDRSREKSYRPFDPWLRNIFHHADIALAAATEPLLRQLVSEAEAIGNEAVSRTARRGVAAARHMPTEIKIMALQALSDMDLRFAKEHHVEQLHGMLAATPPAGLKVTAAYVPDQ